MLVSSMYLLKHVKISHKVQKWIVIINVLFVSFNTVYHVNNVYKTYNIIYVIIKHAINIPQSAETESYY